MLVTIWSEFKIPGVCLVRFRENLTNLAVHKLEGILGQPLGFGNNVMARSMESRLRSFPATFFVLSRRFVAWRMFPRDLVDERDDGS